MTAVAGAVFTAAQYNTYIRDNLLEESPALATQVSSFMVADGVGSLAERVPDEAYAAGVSTTASVTYTNLADGLSTAVTVATGDRALVSIFCNFFNSGANRTWMSYAVTGATTIAALDSRSINQGDTAGMRWGATWLQDSLTPGNNTFVLKYRVTAGTGSFSVRRIAVVPF